MIKALWRIGIVRYNRDGSVRWPVHVSPWHVWRCLWQGVWGHRVGIFRNLPGIRRDCHSWLPRRWGFHILGLDIGQRDEGWPENVGCEPPSVNLYDDAHLGGAYEEEEGRASMDAFAVLVKGWLERCTVTDAELAEAFDISRPSCARWRAGRCRPHPAMRKHIRAFFAERLASQPGEGRNG